MNVSVKLIACIALLHTATANQAQTFVEIPGGKYTVGKQGHSVNPLRTVSVGVFFIATTEITNLQFDKFVVATRYVTDAERLFNAMVYTAGNNEWKRDSSANWRYPNGRSKGFIYDDNRLNHPVACISYFDALVYCKWAGVRLPFVDEWEVAARAGSDKDYFFGGDISLLSNYANILDGPTQKVGDNKADTFSLTAPVGRFLPSPKGLYDIYGNIAELCVGRLPNDKNENIVHTRGGSWRDSRVNGTMLNSYDAGSVDRHASYSNQGFRVAK